MRKRFSILFICIILVFSLAGCGGNTATTSDDGKLSIVTTIFPEYDWVMNILGDKAEDANVTMLLDSGVDLHSYQPSADDIVTISTADVFIYVGGESDAWVEDALKEAVNKDMVVINLMDVVGAAAKEEEIVEGMQAEEEEEGPEYDEHLWLSLKMTSSLCDAIGNGIAQADPDNANIYKANASAYIDKLNELDSRYQEAVDNAQCHTILFGDRFPFRYMADDYGLDYFAAFVGCSAESEASFETIKFLAGKVDELGLKSVMTLEGTDHKIAQTIINTSKKQSAEILSMNSMQSTTGEDVSNGATYLSIMENNLNVLTQALNK